jgi:hypothetical protein
MPTLPNPLTRTMRVLVGAIRTFVGRFFRGDEPEPLAAMAESWRTYRESLDRFYALAEGRLAEGASLEPGELERLDPALDGALAASEQIRRAAERGLRTTHGLEHEGLTDMLLATAAVDAMVAVDLAAVDPDLAYYSGGLRESGEERTGERREMLADADRLFGIEGEGPAPIAGAQLDPGADALRAEAWGRIDELVELASRPALRIGTSIASLALGRLIEVVSLDVGRTFRDALRDVGVGRRTLRFVGEHAKKLLEVVAPGFADEMVELASEGAQVERVVGRVAGADRGKEEVARQLHRAQPVPDPRASELQLGMKRLIDGYETQMKWVGRGAKWVGWGKEILSVLLVHVGGPLAVAGILLAGGAYVGYSATDRIDGRDLGPLDLVDGVVRLSERLEPTR